MTKLIELVRAGDLAGMQQELAAGANPYAPDKNGFSALQLAAMYGNTPALRSLLDHSVDIRRSTANGWNPLALALRYSHFDAATLLLDAGADVNAPQPLGGVTPLSFAATYGNAAMVQRLLERGADPRATDERGATALDTARLCMEGTPSRRAAYEQIVRRLEAADGREESPRDTLTKQDSGAPGEDFFAYWRENRVAAMTLVDLQADGGLYYYASPYHCTVWVFAGVDSLIISYLLKGDGPDQVRAEVRRLLGALHGRGDPGAWKDRGYPNYAARLDPGTGKLTVACFHPGDWYGLTRIEPLPVHWDQLPAGWPDAYRSRLAELAAERIRLAESSGSFSILDSVGRALVRQSMHAQAERLYRRALAICEETVGAEHTDTASSLQAIGVTLAFQARYAEAEEMLRRALAAWILIRGPEHPYVASALNSIGGVLERQGNHSEANALRDRAKAILEQNQAKTKS